MLVLLGLVKEPVQDCGHEVVWDLELVRELVGYVVVEDDDEVDNDDDDDRIIPQQQLSEVASWLA